MEIAGSDLNRIRELYLAGLYLQAYEASQPFGPLRHWTTPASRLLGGRLAMQLGAPKLGRRMHLLAFRQNSSYPEAIYYHARYRMERFGPFSAWQFMREHSDWSDSSPELRADWLALGGFIASRFRDFDRAEKLLDQADSTCPNRPWGSVERAAVYEAADRFDDAMKAARRSLELHPWFRPGVQAVAHVLQRMGKPREAAEFLAEAVSHMECGMIYGQLAALHLDHGDAAAARPCVERYVELSPLMEPEAVKWVAARRADVGYLLGEPQFAAENARKVGEPFYTALADRLSVDPIPTTPARTQLSADLSYERTPIPVPELLARFWSNLLPKPDANEPPPTLDGLPDRAERSRFDAAGWITREFTLSLSAATAILERELPFLITLVEAGYGQSRLVLGVDRLRESILFADGIERHVAEAPVSVLLDRYKSVGPRCLLAVPKEHAAKLDGLDLPDSAVYDRLYRIQSALVEHRFPDAKEQIASLRTEYPNHRITKQAAVAWARATSHPVLLLDAMDALLMDYPHEPGLVLSKAAAFRELGRMAERLELLEAEGRKHDSEPMLIQSLAQMLLPIPSRQYEADLLLRRSLRLRPMAAPGYFLLASQRWEHQKFQEAADIYRMSVCLDEREDQFADAYARAARSVDQVPEVLRLFQQRASRAATPSPTAVKCLFNALLDRDEPEQAFGMLAKAIEKLEANRAANPDEPPTALAELRLFRAEMWSNEGDFEAAEAELASAKTIASPAAWLKVASRVTRSKPDYLATLAHVRELVALEPLNVETQRVVAGLISDTEGRPAARQYLLDLANRWPDYYPIGKLWSEFASRPPADLAETGTKVLLTLCPHDAWVHRQLALIYADQRRHEDALAAIKEAAKTEPHHPSHYAVLGHIHRKADRLEDALEAFRDGIRHMPDHELCIIELVQHSRGVKEKKAALRFVAEQLHTKPFIGEGLLTYFDQASRLIDDPEEQERFLDVINRFLDERPDLWHCWTLAIQQHAVMHRTEEAISLAREATARFPLSARLWADLAEACRLAEQPDDRLEALRESAAVAPGWPPVARELAEALHESDDEEGAIHVMRTAVERNPLDSYTRWLLAERLWDAGHSEEAIAEAKRSVMHDPVYDPERPPSPEYAWGAVNIWSERMDRPEEPVQFARELTKMRAGDPRAWLRLARALTDFDQAEEALEALDKAIALDPRNSEAHDLKAEKLAQLGRYDEALEAARPSILAENLPLTLQGRAAWIEARRGNYAAAIPPMQALVAVDPEYVWGWQQLAEWYNDTGRPESYLEAASELVRLRPESPFHLALRGEARIQTGDRAGGKEDLREALRIHPGYSHAAAVLFDTCLADDELREARSALAVLQEYLVGPEVLVKQLQYAARTGDKDAAVRTYAELCEHPGEGPSVFLQLGTTEMRNAGYMEQAEEILTEVWQTDEPFNPWAALYWMDTESGRKATIDDTISACDAALKHYPAFIPAHDRKAELLAVAGRFDEAARACIPEKVGPPIPIPLLGRAAWVEERRGNRETAIAMMKQILEKEPDYSWGWRQLEQWYDSSGNQRERLAAAEQLVRLAPDDPFSVGLRGDARRALGDHRGARDDFERAFSLDPTFDAAGLQLVAAQLATDDLTGAAKTLETLQEHSTSPLVQLRAVQVAVRQGDLAAAREDFEQLCLDPGVTKQLLREAYQSFEDAKWQDEADEELNQLMDNPEITPAAAALWVERMIVFNNGWKVADRLPRLVETSPKAGREAIVTYAYTMAVLGQGDKTAATIQMYSNLLREDSESWSRAGASLAEARQWGLTAAWLSDWKKREDVTPWMLRPLVDAYHALGQDADAETVILETSDLEEYELPAEFLAWLAISAAIKGNLDEAKDYLEEIDLVGEPDSAQLLVAMAQAVVKVQSAEASARAEAFAEAKKDVQSAAGACELRQVPPGAARWWLKCADRMAADAGGFSAKAWAWWQRVRPWVREQ